MNPSVGGDLVDLGDVAAELGAHGGHDAQDVVVGTEREEDVPRDKVVERGAEAVDVGAAIEGNVAVDLLGPDVEG